MNPRYQDISGRTSPRPQPEWVTRGWRLRSELEPGQRLMKVEAEVERLSAELGALKAAVQDLRDNANIDPTHDIWPDQPLTKLYALVPGAPVGGGS